MEESLLKKLGMPVREVVLSSPKSENQGILIQETLPPFSLYTRDNLRVDVAGIPMPELTNAFEKDYERYLAISIKKEKVQTKHLWAVFEKYIRAVPNCPKDISFVQGSLVRFFQEYRALRNENLDISALIRSAIQDGIHFDFYEKGNTRGAAVKSLEGNVAQYTNKHRAIEFNCSRYLSNPKRVHNTLAHELCHYIMDDKGKGGYFGTFAESDIGVLWYEMIKSEAFYGKKEWDKAKKEIIAEKGKIYGTSPFFTYLESEYKSALKNYPKPQQRMGEMFARTMGIMAEWNKGLDGFSKYDMKRIGLQLVCDLASARANKNDPLYHMMIDAIRETKMGIKTRDRLLCVKGCQEEILEKGEFSKNEYMDSIHYSSKLDESVRDVYFQLLDRLWRKRTQQATEEQVKTEDASFKQNSGFYNRLAKASDGLIPNGRIQLRREQKKRLKPAAPKYPIVPVPSKHDGK